MGSQNYNNHERLGFLRVILRICAGTAVFASLIKRPPWKAVVYLLALALIAAGFIALVKIHLISKKVDDSCVRLEAEFGALEIDAAGISPSIEPERGRELMLPDNLRFEYRPQGVQPGQIVGERGIVWTRGIIAAWLSIEDNRYLICPLVYPLPTRWPTAFDSAAAAADHVNQTPSSSGEYSLKLPAPVPFSTLKSPIVVMLAAVMFLLFLAQIVFTAMLYTLMVAGMFYWLNRARLRSLRSFRQTFAIGLYAGFPALMVGALFPAFDLPWLDFPTAFLIGFIVYFIVVINSLERRIAAAPDRHS